MSAGLRAAADAATAACARATARPAVWRGAHSFAPQSATLLAQRPPCAAHSAPRAAAGHGCLAARSSWSSLFRSLHATAAARDEPVKNAKINFPEVLVISESGESLGVKTVPEAMALFDAKEMDLVLVSTSQMPPVCRIVSKKAAYEKKKNEVRKRPNASVVKELEINSTITDHDLEIKLNKATELLEKGYRLQVTVFERGNKNSPVVIKKIIASLQSHGSVAGMPDVSGKKIIVNFESKTKK